MGRVLGCVWNGRFWLQLIEPCSGQCGQSRTISTEHRGMLSRRANARPFSISWLLTNGAVETLCCVLHTELLSIILSSDYSRYSNRLLAGRRKGQQFSLLHVVQTGSEAHPASYPTGTGGSFPASKADGAWNWPLTSNYSRGQENMAL
jgi:hypothetical protein